MTTKLSTWVTLAILASSWGAAQRACAQTNAEITGLRRQKEKIASHPNDPDARAAQIQLAKLGEVQELQEIYCQLYSTYREDILDAAQIKLPAVGGWFAIKSLHQMFDADLRFRRARVRTSDLSFPDAHQFGLLLLPKLVPNPPFALDNGVILESEGEQQRKVVIWKKSILERQAELAKLQPTGSGVELSATACKDGRPRRRY